MLKFGMKVPHLRCDSRTSFKVKRSHVRVTDERGHTVLAEPGSHPACFKQLELNFEYNCVSSIELIRKY